MLEKNSPKHKDLDIKSHLKLDIMAFFLIIISVNVSRIMATAFFEQISFENLGVI